LSSRFALLEEDMLLVRNQSTPDRRLPLATSGPLRRKQVEARRLKSYEHWVSDLEGSKADCNLSCLKGAAVTQKTHQEYLKRVRDMELHWKDHGIKAEGTEAQIDEAAVFYLHWRFFAGYDSSDGIKLPAGFQHIHPQFSKRGALHLPRCARVFRGWKRLAPAHSRTPPPWPLMCAAIVRFWCLSLVSLCWWAQMRI